MNHFLDIHKTDPAHLRAMIDSAQAMKTARNGRPRGAPDDHQPLKGHMVALIFEKPSTRTRVSFDVACARWGARRWCFPERRCSLAMARPSPTPPVSCRAMST